MFQMKKKRVRLTMEEKLWVVNHNEQNPKISQAKICLDFSAKFKRPISRQCVCNIIHERKNHKNKKILEYIILSWVLKV